MIIHVCDNCGKGGELRAEFHETGQYMDAAGSRDYSGENVELCLPCTIEMLKFVLNKLKWGEDEGRFYEINRAVIERFGGKG